MPEFTQLDRIESRLARLEQKIDTLTALGRLTLAEELNMANTLDTLTQKVAAEDTVIQSAITLLQGLSAEVRGLQPTQQAIDELANKIDQQTSSLASAVQANTTAPQG